MDTISSRANPIVGLVRRLARRKDRDDPRILLDGARLVRDALDAGVALELAAATAGFLASPDGARLAARLTSAGTRVLRVSDAVMSALSPVATPAGIIGVGFRRPVALDEALDATVPLVVIAVHVQDPGNAGAIARAAEAGGATGMVACGATADPFGWKALRGAMGSAFRLPIASEPDVAVALERARSRGLRIVAAAPHGGHDIYAANLTRALAFVVGTEGAGLPPAVLADADERVTIPMRPPVESLNVAVATALLVYEAARQRRHAGAAGRRRSAR